MTHAQGVAAWGGDFTEEDHVGGMAGDWNLFGPPCGLLHRSVFALSLAPPQMRRAHLHDLNCFKTRNVVKKPPAAGIHKHGVALHLNQFHKGGFVTIPELPTNPPGDEFVYIFTASIHYHINVIIPKLP